VNAGIVAKWSQTKKNNDCPQPPQTGRKDFPL
jgi:hypothetical protein